MYEIIYAYIILTSIRKKKNTTLLWAKVRRADFHFSYIHANPLLSENRKYFLHVQGSNHFG